MRARQRMWAALLIGLVAGGVAGGLAGHGWTPSAARSGPTAGGAPAASAMSESGTAAPAATSAPAAITATTEIVTRTAYQEGSCRQTVEETTTAPADWVGLTRQDMAKRFPDATIESFSAKRVVITRSTPGCPYVGRTILLRMGRVGVYYGTLSDLGPLERETDITVDQLTSQDKARLQAGIVVDSEVDVDRLLEGLRE